MKRAILSVLLLFAFLTGFAQNRNICRLGITYDISQSDHWGKSKPVLPVSSLIRQQNLQVLKPTISLLLSTACKQQIFRPKRSVKC